MADSMIKIIGKEIKQQMKGQRLDQYKRRYFELEMDRIALLANGDEEGAKATVLRMKAVEDAYNAVSEVQED